MALENLGEHIRTIRKERGLSQEALARRADVSLNLVGKLELGLVLNPHYGTLAGLARALGVTVEELVEEPILVGPKADAPQAGATVYSFEGAPAPAVILERLHDWAISASREEAVVLSQYLHLAEVPASSPVAIGYVKARNGEEVDHERVLKELLPLFLAPRDTALFEVLHRELVPA
jgi:transcriptional regulator with XRE-family HTH domain